MEIVVDPEAGAPELDVRSYLMGNLFAVLCHQRGLLPLHASAIATPRGAVAFLGTSGAGKSSMVAFLSQRGHRVLADDICLIDPAAPRDRRVLPVAPWLKLWSTTLDAMGESSHGLSRIFSDDEKYRYALQEPEAPTPLAELILLERAEPQAEVSFERLAPVHALHAMLDLTYQSWLVRAIGRTERLFLRCGQALEGARVVRMRRPWGFDAMEATLTALEAHLASMPWIRRAEEWIHLSYVAGLLLVEWIGAKSSALSPPSSIRWSTSSQVCARSLRSAERRTP